MPRLPKDAVLVPKLPPDCSVKVIGLGGVGSIVARYAAVFLASLGPCRLVLIDGDEFEPSNASRMLFGACGNKAKVVREELLPRFKDSPLTLVSVEEYITTENISRLVQDGDIVLLCVDNHNTRKLVDDHLLGNWRSFYYDGHQMPKTVLISGGNDGVDKGNRGTYGSVQACPDRSVNLSKYHPEIANPKDKHPGDKNCTELVTSVPQILMANLAVASAMLNALWLHLCGQLHYAELSFDIAEGLMRPTIPIKKGQT